MNVRLEGDIIITRVEYTPGGYITINYQLIPKLNPTMAQSMTMSGTLPSHFQDRMRFIFEEWLQGKLMEQSMIQ